MRKKRFHISLVMLNFLFCIVSVAQMGTLQKIRAAFPPYTDCAQLFVAIEKGYFREEGLEVEPVSIVEGRTILEEVSKGNISLGFGNLVSLIASRSAGSDLVAITGGPAEDTAHIENGIFVRNNAGIQNVAELAGKKIAVNVRRNIIELVLLEYLARSNIPLHSVEIVEIPFPQMLNSLLNGNVDAAPLIVPFKSMAERNPDVKLLCNYVVEMFPRFESSSWLVSRKWADDNKNTVSKMQRALKKATEFCRQHPDELKPIILKYVPFSKEVMDNTVLPAFHSRLSESGLDTIMDMMLRFGWINEKFPARSLMY